MIFVDAECTVDGVGEELEGEVRLALGNRDRCVALHREAVRKTRVLVCGLFFRLAGERKVQERLLKLQQRRAKGAKRRKRRDRKAPRKRAKRGLPREREVEAFWGSVASMDVGDFNGSYFDLSPWRSAVVVPRYSDGSQWAGQPSLSPGRALSHRTVTYHSRPQRLAAVATSAGIECRVEGGVVRLGGKRRRPEDGGDCSGVT